MYTISRERILSMNRGDTFRTPLFINVGTKLKKKRYILSYDDTVYLSISEPDKPFERGILRQIYTCKNLNSSSISFLFSTISSSNSCILILASSISF